MLPWGHLAVGYVVYSLGVRLWRRRGPEGAPTIALALGTQLPDLVDKPANWFFDVFDGRGAGHSVFVVVPFCALILVLAHRRDRGALGVALSVGLLTHLLGDAWRGLFEGELVAEAPYLFWPLLDAPTYEKDSLMDHLQEWFAILQTAQYRSLGELLTTSFGLQFAFFVLLVGMWAVDGFPGLGLVWRRTVGAVRRSL